METLILILGLVIGFLIALLRSNTIKSNANTKIIDLTAKIALKKEEETILRRQSEDAVKEYEKAKKDET